MKVRVHKGSLIQRPVEIDGAESVVIFDDYEQPILVAQRTGDGQIISVGAGDPKFQAMLKMLGIGLNVTVSRKQLS